MISTRRISSSLLALAAALLAPGARADVLHIPADFPTLDEAAEVAQPGDVILFAAGTYHDPVAATDLHDVTIRGQGLVILAGGSAGTPALELVNCTNVTVEHLRVTDAPDVGVEVSGSGVTLSHVRVETAAVLAIHGVLSDSLLDHCVVQGPGNNGIILDDSDHVTILRCTVKGTLNVGIGLSQTEACLVDRCHVTDGGVYAIGLGISLPSSGCQVRKCVVGGVNDVGLYVLGGDNLLLDNRVKDVGGPGIELDFGSSGGLVQHNRLIGCAEGIITRAANPLLRDDRIVKSLFEGIFCEGPGAVLVDERVLHAGFHAFSIDPTVVGGSFTGCKAVHPVSNGYEVGGSQLTFNGSTSVGTGEAGFHVTGTDNLFVGNTAKGSGTIGLDDEVGGNSYLENDFGILN